MSTPDEFSTPKRQHDDDSEVFSDDDEQSLFIPEDPERERKRSKRVNAQLNMPASPEVEISASADVDVSAKTEPDMFASAGLDVSATTEPDISTPTERSTSAMRSIHFTSDNFNTDDQPRSPFFHPSRPRLEKLATDVVEEVTRLFQQPDTQKIREPDLGRMITILNKYANPAANYEASKPIAFTGRAGVGKSLTLSCIINKPGISQDNQSTVRGTNVTIEFTHLKKDRQPQATEDNLTQSKYVVCPTYFTDEEIRAKVWQICVDSFAFLDSCDHDSEIKVEAQDLSSDSAHSESRERRKAYDSAKRYLVTLLCGETDFQSEEHIDLFFQRMYAYRKTSLEGGICVANTLDDKVLVETANVLTAPILEFSQTRTGETFINDLSELKQACNDITKPGPTNRGHPWPTINKLTVSLENPLLEAGAILGDTPGMSDEDQTVSESMLRYVRDAGTLFICCALARSQQDSVVEEAIRIAVHLGLQRSTYLILTRIDDWRSERTEEEKLCTIPAEDALEIQLAEEEETSLVERQRVLSEEIEQWTGERSAVEIRQNEIMAKLVSDKTLFQDLMSVTSRTQELNAMIHLAQAELNNLPGLVKMAQSRIEECKTDACNRSDQRLLQTHLDEIKGNHANKIRAYSNNNQDPDLPVFFVSGKQYQKGLLGLTGAEGPWLDNEATGIPSVRRKLYGLITATHFPKLKQIDSADIPRLLRRGIACLSKTPLAEMTKIEIGIEVSIEKGIEQVLKCFSNGMNNAFIDHIEACFENEESILAWMVEAKTVAQQLFKHQSVVFKSFCAKKGNWRVKMKKMSWNGLIIKIYSEVVRSAWDDFLARCADVKSDTTELINKSFDDLRISLANGPYKGERGYDDFIAATYDAQNELKLKVEAFWAEIMHDLETVRTNLLLDSEHDAQSYVAKAMTPGYDEAAKMMSSSFPNTPKLRRAKAAHNARFAAVERSILGTTSTADEPGLPNVFDAVKQIAHDDFGTKLKEIEASFEDFLKTEILDTLKADFSHRHGVSSDPTDQGAKARAKMLATLQDCHKRLTEGEGKKWIAECEGGSSNRKI